jgi:hypothetical protein
MHTIQKDLAPEALIKGRVRRIWSVLLLAAGMLLTAIWGAVLCYGFFKLFEITYEQMISAQ